MAASQRGEDDGCMGLSAGRCWCVVYLWGMVCCWDVLGVWKVLCAVVVWLVGVSRGAGVWVLVVWAWGVMGGGWWC